MTRTKKIFTGFVVIFIVLLAYASYDISRRTTFPGSKSQLRERIKKNYLGQDTAFRDSGRHVQDTLSRQ